MQRIALTLYLAHQTVTHVLATEMTDQVTVVVITTARGTATRVGKPPAARTR